MSDVANVAQHADRELYKDTSPHDGAGDRWADIAVAAMSTEWNYGPGWGDTLIAAYGVEPDRERLEYYRELWNAT